MKRTPILLISPDASRDALRKQLDRTFRVACVSDSRDCEPRLREVAVRAIVVAFEAPAHCIDEVLALLDRLGVRIPVLALRDRHAEDKPSWHDRVAILRSPLLPDVLSRSVSIVVQMQPSR